MTGVTGATTPPGQGATVQGFSQQTIQDLQRILSDFTTTYSTTSGDGADTQTGATGGSGAPPPLDAPKLDATSMASLLMEIQTKLQDEQLKTSKGDIKDNMIKKQEAHKEVIAKLKECAEKMNESKKAGVFGKVFGWIGTALLAVAAVVTMNPALMIAAALMITMQISSETGNWLNEGIGKVFEEMGMDAKDAQLAAMITLTVIVVALSLGAGGSAAATEGTKTALQVTADVIAKMAQIGAGVAQVGKGATQVATSVITKEAEDARADSMEFKKFMTQLQTLMEDEMKRIKEILDKMQDGVSSVIDIISKEADTKSFIIQQHGV